MDQIELAKKIAFEKHNGQFRRDGVTPYINHPAEVVRLLEKSNASAHEIAAGWLHDVIEDTGTTLEELTNLGVSEDVLFIVGYLTRLQQESYEDFIKRIYPSVRASKIKVADIIANLNDDPTPKQVKKYAKALKTLLF